MKTVLYMVTSLDGKTTLGDNDTSWVSTYEIDRLDSYMRACGAMIMGSKTYESFGDDLPADQAFLVVLTHDQKLLQQPATANLLFTDDEPESILKMLAERGFTQVMIAGGESLNSSLIRDHLLDEIWLLVKPLVLGHGKSLFTGDALQSSATLLGVTELDNGLVELKYALKKY